MAIEKFIPNASYDQGVASNINDLDFDFQNEIDDRLDRIRLIADIITVQIDGQITISDHGLSGAYTILDDSIKEIRSICAKLCWSK